MTTLTDKAVVHDRCEGCGRDVCGCDPDLIIVHPATVLLGCGHQRVLCIDCMTQCDACRAEKIFDVGELDWGWGS